MDTHGKNGGDIAKCPFHNGSMAAAAGKGMQNQDWWPNQLKLNILRQHSTLSNPLEEGFDYAKEFESLNLAEVKADIEKVLRANLGHGSRRVEIGLR
jgi:catalase-peroxidase